MAAERESEEARKKVGPDPAEMLISAVLHRRLKPGILPAPRVICLRQSRTQDTSALRNSRNKERFRADKSFPVVCVLQDPLEFFFRFRVFSSSVLSVSVNVRA